MKINLLILFVMMVFFAACSRQQKDALTITNYNIPEHQKYDFNTSTGIGNAPSAISDYFSAESNEVNSVTNKGIASAQKLKKSYENVQLYQINVIDTIPEEDTTKLEPLVITGTALMAGGVATSALVLLSNPFTIWIPVALLAASAIITAIGWRRIKNEPKKYKGEKLAVLNYLVIGIIGVAASVYLIWLLFEL